VQAPEPQDCGRYGPPRAVGRAKWSRCRVLDDPKLGVKEWERSPANGSRP
jgi:hypothetical protein